MKRIKCFIVISSLVYLCIFTCMNEVCNRSANKEAIQELYAIEYKYVFDEDSLSALSTSNNYTSIELLEKYVERRFDYELNYIVSEKMSEEDTYIFLSELQSISLNECTQYFRLFIKQQICFDKLRVSKTDSEKVAVYEELRLYEPLLYVNWCRYFIQYRKTLLLIRDLSLFILVFNSLYTLFTFCRKGSYGSIK